MNWMEGYFADVDYTYGSYHELNPVRIALAFLNAGLAYPQCGTACELGFGHGMNVNLQAAASITQWWGTDFSPSQATFAQELASTSGAGARLFDEAFAEFCVRPDLPDFDFIGLHGIWSWISDSNRAVIVEFIRRKLKPGGVVYLGYNTTPGWAAIAPVRDVITQHASFMSAPGLGVFPRIEASLDFAERLLAVNPKYLLANPQIAGRIKALRGKTPAYLAHEYFVGSNWQPMPFARMAEWLEPAKLSYACSADYLDHVDALHMTTEQRSMLGEVQDPVFCQTVRDFMLNQLFRRDYWVKGARKLPRLEQASLLGDLRVMLVAAAADVQMKVKGGIGEVPLQEAIFRPIIQLLADHVPRTLTQIEAALKGKNGMDGAKILNAVLILAGKEDLVVVQSDLVIEKAQARTAKLNAHLLQKARFSSELQFLASPVTGGVVNVRHFQQLFLLAIAQGHKQPGDWAHYAWAVLAAQGKQLTKHGQPLNTVPENLAELGHQAQDFATRSLPGLRALKVA